MRDDAPLPDERQGLVGFAHRPLDTRSACVVVLPAGLSQPDDVAACRDIGASLFFVAGDGRWDVWKQTREQPIHRQALKTSEVENYFRQHRDQFAPGAIFRAKSWQRAGEGQQLDFVDADLLLMLERDAGLRLRNLFEHMVATTMDFLRWKSVPEKNEDAHWLTKANFWLLAAKLLQDKRVPRFIKLDLGDVRTVFARVAYHYNPNNPNPPKINCRLRALQEAARLVAAPPHFRNISAETLGVLYEEALISPTTRKLLGTHRTPTYLVDYMLARLGGWIEELGYKRCHIFEPACGHAPFLSGALRLVSNMLPASIADDPKERHDFLKGHLRGCDNDSFALEIARLSLTLADIPNENGWVLNDGDMFAGSTLADETKSASVVLANPPFESEKAAKFLQ
ncbi:MAG TPA: N-6 DNA methylase, partial [Verrucomicrobiae bacterium]|nr:N-6 DNA methylase [Verrucomicrobiae bacterium]